MFWNKSKKKKRGFSVKEKNTLFSDRVRRQILGIFLLLASALVALSFFGKAGIAGAYFMRGAKFGIGETVFMTPLILLLGGLIFLKTNYRLEFEEKGSVFWQAILAMLVLILGITGMLGGFESSKRLGGWLGDVISWPFLTYFGFWAAQLIFAALIITGAVVFWQFLKPAKEKEKKEDQKFGFSADSGVKKPSFIKKIFSPKFQVKEISGSNPVETKPELKPASAQKTDLKTVSKGKVFAYVPPPLDLLESDKGQPTSGDIKVNSAVIKKTLQNFGIDVQMSEVNVGPTVTQYTFKPAEGVKLSKITTLVNDLSLALASHPLRIEAPVPGRSLVGIEMPNKVRAQVRLKDMLATDNFQHSQASLLLALGRDVSGNPIYSDLAKMPHILVAGSTGSGKTIFLNNLILSLMYQPSTNFKSAGPENLRLILVDPKRVEFPVYSDLPHLLCPVIYNASQTVNALKWLISEMERRFMVLAEAKARDISSFNQGTLKRGEPVLPFIVLVIDELADLMAARGRDIEGQIVRLAQMSRAVGIHLVVATQRPSVEVITGLIKANITARVTFLLASQVDSRTILDMAGAERLLGAGDMLYMSAETGKPRRIQSAYVSEKEVRAVINYIKDNNPKSEDSSELEDALANQLESSSSEFGGGGGTSDDDDPLYFEAKNVVVEAKKASASLLQRRLRIGYARAARLLDILEAKGVIGPAEGSKPREVFFKDESGLLKAEAPEGIVADEEETNDEEKDDSDWEKV